MIITRWVCLAPSHLDRCTADEPGHVPFERQRRVQSFFCFSEDVAYRCDTEGCTNEVPIKDHHWDQINATVKKGWFFRKDLSVITCPDHLTDGIIAWRDYNNPGWRDRLEKQRAARLPSVEAARAGARATSDRAAVKALRAARKG